MISNENVNVILPAPAFKVDQMRSNPSRPARPHDKEYKGIIFDAHVHLHPPDTGDIDEVKLKKIIEVIKSQGVELAIFMPTPNDGRKPFHEEGVRQNIILFNLDKKRIRLFCGGNYITYWLHCAYHDGLPEEERELRRILTRLRKDIDSGEYAGVGEIGIYHFRKHGKQPVIYYPPNFRPFLKIVDLVARKGMWLDLHTEPVDPTGISYEELVFGGIELLFRRNPHLKLIYSHTAMTNPANARMILLKYPNVVMNIKITKHYRWKNLEPITNDPGMELYEDWAQLFEEMPERFMIGTDSKFGLEGVWVESKRNTAFPVSKYREKIKEVRRILGTLHPQAARMIAYENAKRIFMIN